MISDGVIAFAQRWVFFTPLCEDVFLDVQFLPGFMAGQDVQPLFVLSWVWNSILPVHALNLVKSGRKENSQQPFIVFCLGSKWNRVRDVNQLTYMWIDQNSHSKTTAMLAKMLDIEQSWQQYGCNLPRPRQLFATQSCFLVERVEDYFYKLQQSLHISDQPSKPAMLVTNSSSNQQGLYDADEKPAVQEHLPKHFAELKDDHFSMFITFDHVSPIPQCISNY